jgi:hypothetical protein
MAVVPVDAAAELLFLEDFLDHSLPRRLRRSLGLGHDAVSNLHSHDSSSQISLPR